jgi:restriction system protein
MAIPSFQEAMLPLLRLLADGRERSNAEIYECLADEFKLSEEEREKLLPSGKQRLFVNRIAWAKSHLKQAGLLESSCRGVYRITQSGVDVMARAPASLDMASLMEFAEYRAFRNSDTPTRRQGAATDATAEPRTPQETIEAAEQDLRAELREQILGAVSRISPRQFELIVVDLMLAMGYGGSRKEAGMPTELGADGGVDGVISEDRLGLDKIYVQAKRWSDTVGRPEIQKFAGALHGKRAKKGVFITTSTFSPAATDFVTAIELKIVLIDGQRLADLMIDFGVGVTVEQVIQIKRLDSDYFTDE